MTTNSINSITDIGLEKTNETWKLNQTEVKKLNTVDAKDFEKLETVLAAQTFELGEGANKKTMTLKDIVDNYDTAKYSIKVWTEYVPVARGSELWARIQMYLLANKKSVYYRKSWIAGTTHGIDWDIGQETIKSIQDIQKSSWTNTGGTNTGGTNTLNVGNLMEKKIKDQVELISYNDMKGYMTTPMQRFFVRASAEWIFDKTTWTLQSNASSSNGYYTIDQTKKTLNINISTNSTLSIKGQIYTLDLTKFVDATWTVDLAKYAPELCKAIIKMYKANETVKQNAQRAIIETQYAKILLGTDSPYAQSTAIDKLVVQLKALQATATKLGLTTSLASINTDITNYTKKSSELVGSSFSNARKAIEVTTTKIGQIDAARTAYLDKELKEINRIKGGLTWTELIAANKRLDLNLKEKAYIAKKISDVSDIHTIKKMENGVIKKGYIKTLLDDVNKDDHKTIYTDAGQWTEYTQLQTRLTNGGQGRGLMINYR